MTIYERIGEEVKKKLGAKQPTSHRPKKKETFSKEDIEELMGMNNPVYKKVKGRVRQQ